LAFGLSRHTHLLSAMFQFLSQRYCLSSVARKVCCSFQTTQSCGRICKKSKLLVMGSQYSTATALSHALPKLRRYCQIGAGQVGVQGRHGYVAPNNSVGDFPVIQTSSAAASALLPLLLLLRAGARCSSGPLCGGEAGTIRPRSGRGHGWTRLFDRTGVRPKSPATTHELAGQDARRAPHRGALSLWLLLFEHAKRK